MTGCVSELKTPIALESDSDYISFADVERRFESMYHTYNPYQKEALEAITKAFNDGCKVVVLKAPVAFGKSAIGYSMCVNRSFYVVPFTTLQSQLKKDFRKDETFCIIKGRKKYDCIVNGKKCDVGTCKLEKGNFNPKACGDTGSIKNDEKRTKKDKFYCGDCDFLKNMRSSSARCTSCKDKCEYFKALLEAARAQVCVMSSSFFFLSHNLSEGKNRITGENDWLFPKTNLLIFDEAHTVPKILLQQVSVSFHILKIKKYMEKADAEKFKIPHYDLEKHPEKGVEWLKTIVLPILDKRKEYYKTAIQLTEEEALLEGQLKDFRKKVIYLINEYEKNPTKWLSEWVAQDVIETKEPYKGQVKSISFQPINAQKYVKKRLWDRADKILLMTATYDKLIESSDFGLNDVNCKILEYPPSNTTSIIEKKRRPILYIPQEGSLSKGYAEREETIKSIAKCIEKIIIRHTGENGIIHCQSYDNANKIYDILNQSKLPNDVKNKIILQKQHHRNENLKDFIINGGIFLSVCMTDGLDLKDNRCRYSILACVPFANKGDKRVNKKCEQNRSWYSWLAIRDICQAYGRAVRNNGDKAVFYILDNRFESLYKNYKKYFPNWFTDYIESKGGIEKIRGKYLGIKELQEYAALELTKDDKNGAMQSL